jgi:hypothetical protein
MDGAYCFLAGCVSRVLFTRCNTVGSLKIRFRCQLFLSHVLYHLCAAVSWPVYAMHRKFVGTNLFDVVRVNRLSKLVNL